MAELPVRHVCVASMVQGVETPLVAERQEGARQALLLRVPGVPYVEIHIPTQYDRGVRYWKLE